MCKFTIIVPVYNAADYLSRSIDSILLQSVPDFELILINDGSSDNSGKICDNYANLDNRIRVFHQENKGVSFARNQGLVMANGEWVLFVDADDWIEPIWLETLIKKIQTFDLDLYTFGCRRINNQSVEYIHLPPYTVENNHNFVKTPYYKHSVWAYAFRNSIIQKNDIKFPDKLKYSEDQAFLLKYISKCDKVVSLNKVLYNYYNSPDSVVNRPISIYSSICNIWAANDFLEFCILNNIPESFFEHPVRQLYDDFFMYLSMIPDVNKREVQKEYKKAYKKTVQLYPGFGKHRYYKIAYYQLSLPKSLSEGKNKIKKIKYKISMFSRLKQAIYNAIHINRIVREIVYEESQHNKDFIKIERYRHLAEESTTTGVTTSKYFDHEVIVSLTTYGKRIHDVYLTIESIMHQTAKPNKIILWLAEDEFTMNTIPISLKRLIDRGLTIEFCEDIKSYKKLVPALQRYPDSIIITIDDDVAYQQDLIENLLHSYREDPDLIHFCRGHKMRITKDGILDSYTRWDFFINNTLTDKLNFPTGVGGILYPPHCFHEDVTNEKLFMVLCPTADDIWFKAMSLLKGTFSRKVYTHNVNGMDYTILNNDIQDETALWNINITRNDEQIKAVFSKYNLDKSLT